VVEVIVFTHDRQRSTTMRGDYPDRREAAGEVRATTAQVLGLCTTCVHAGTCLFLRAARHPIVHCEEFDDGSGAVRRESAVPTFQPEPYSVAALREEGLCVTCADRNGCMLRHTGVPVHECEEYR
jgi:hypothetical protein